MCNDLNVTSKTMKLLEKKKTKHWVGPWVRQRFLKEEKCFK